MLVDMRFEQVGEVTIATLTGDVDMSNANDVSAALLRAMTNEALALVMDLTHVEYFDSAGIHLLYDLREKLRVRGQRLRIVVPPGSRARDTLELAAVLQSVEADETLESALASVA